MAGTLIRDVRASLDIDVANAQKGLRDLEKSGQSAEKALKNQEDAARGYERQLEKTGSAATTMRRRLEAATRALPKITIDADSTKADTTLANVRESLKGLADQKIGIDISGTAALEEMRRVKGELEELARTEADPIVRADVQIALREINRVEAELDKLESENTVTVDVDTQGAEESARGLGRALDSALGVIGKAGPANVGIAIAAIELLPTVASVAASGIVFAVGGALAGIGLGAVAQSKEVQRAWSELAAELKVELADVAQPLEGSAIRAADVVETTFLRIKPALGRIFQDLVPDVDAFVDGVGAGVVRIMPHLEKVGDSFGKLLSGLGDRLPTIMDNLGETFSTFASMVDEDPQMLANLLDDATKLVATGAEILSWSDDIKAALTLPIDPSGASNKLWEAMFGDSSPEETMQNLERMPETLQAMTLATGKAISTAYELNSGALTAAGGIRDLNAALEEHFDPAQKALDAEIRLKQAIEDANTAAKDKKLTEIERLTSVKDLTGAIADAAKIESERTGKTKESTDAFVSALPRLLDYAGNNDAAKNAVSTLGESLGITAKKTKDGVLAIDELGNVIKVLPNGKKVEIDASTAKGKAEIEAFKLWVARQRGTIDVHVRTIYDNPSGQKAIASKVKARGGIQSTDGAITYMAAGGMLGGSSMSPPPPHIATQATLIPGSNTVHGEAGKEGYIPYAPQHRSRAIALVSEIASDFGLEVVNKAASRSLSNVTVAIDATGLRVVDGLETAVDALDQTMGHTGTLTGAIDRVGVVGESVAETWQTGSQLVAGTVTAVSGQLGTSMTSWGQVVSVSVADMSTKVGTSVGGLGKEVTTLGDVIAKAAEVVRSVAAAKGKGTGGSEGAVLGPGPPGTGGSEGAVLGPGPPGTGGSEGAVIGYRPPTSAAPAPLDPHSSGVSGGSAGVSGWNTPSAMVSASTLRSVPVSSAESFAASSSAAGSGGGGVTIGSFHATPDQSPHQIAEELAWISR